MKNAILCYANAILCKLPENNIVYYAILVMLVMLYYVIYIAFLIYEHIYKIYKMHIHIMLHIRRTT